MVCLRFFLFVLFWSATANVAYGFGVEDALAPDPADKPLDLRIWYPSDAATPNVVKGANLPLIVISHGASGGKELHEDTAQVLADAGFVVVAITHTGDNYRDQSYVRLNRNLSERPRHVISTVDYMLTSWRSHQQIDRERIGMFGFSAGGFTALVIAGGQPDMTRGADHCRQKPNAWDCEYLRKHGVDIRTRQSQPAPVWLHDSRIKAAVIAAPAVGYAFEPDRLAAVRIPIQLWGGEHDRVVDDSADIVRRLLSSAPEYHLVANAGHFSFMKPCNWPMHSIVTVMTWFGTEAICSDPDGFDRARFHADFNAQVVRFFSTALR